MVKTDSSFRGYEASCRQIITAARHFATQIAVRFPSDLYILGDPKVSVVAFGSKTKALSIYQIGDGMGKKGWHLNALSDPGALHMAFTVSRQPFRSGSSADLVSVYQLRVLINCWTILRR